MARASWSATRTREPLRLLRHRRVRADAIEGRAVERVQDVLGPEPARRRILRRRRSLQGNAEDPIDVEVGRDKLLDELDLLDVRGVRLHQEIVDL